MNVLRAADLVASVAKRWAERYSDPSWKGTDKEHKRLYLASHPDMTKEQIDTVIGNDSWTTLICSVCKESVEAVVVLDHDDRNYICRECLSKAIAAIETP